MEMENLKKTFDKKRQISLNCYNPFKKLKHSHSRKSLRSVKPWMCSLIPGMPDKAKVCDTCRKELGIFHKEQQSKDTTYLSSCSQEKSDLDPEISFQSESLQSLNTSLKEIGESPVDKKKSQYKVYSKEKLKKINSAIKRNILLNAESSENENESNERDLMDHLKCKFRTLTSRNEKIMLLTVLPESWSIRKIMEEFSAPSYMVRQSKILIKQKGILSTPNQKPGKSLPPETAKTIIQFYESDEVSRIMPGKKDCISLKDETGSKVHIQKRLILNNLSELYSLFKEKFPNLKIGFSKFAELRPRNCILAGQKGTHTVCVCTMHQNIKLMIENSKLVVLTDGGIRTYKDCLHLIVCETPNSDCYLGHCSTCPGTRVVQMMLEDVFERNIIETITYHQWITVDRCALETITKTSSEFIEVFCEKLSTLNLHDFIAKQQSAFLNQTKENLHESQVIVMGDFAENYSFVLQDEVQSYHWTDSQATVHPFVIYYKQDNQLKNFSFVVISECLEHDTVAVYLFQTKLINYLKEKFGSLLRKIFYFTDGSAAQYKNKKNFLNLCNHIDDFQIAAEWHFFATAHGKGPCDGVGGTVKRLAARASLQRPYENQIQTPTQLYDWAKEHISGINFTYSTHEDYIETRDILKERFEKALTIAGTQKLHAFIPSEKSKCKILVKIFSLSLITAEKSVAPESENMSINESEMNGYVIAVYGGHWWLGYVLEKNEEERQVNISFLHPQGPSSSFIYPPQGDRLWVPTTDVLCAVNPITPTGRTYKLSPEDVTRAIEAFHRFSNE